jgi:hypothetical protein
VASSNWLLTRSDVRRISPKDTPCTTWGIPSDVSWWIKKEKEMQLTKERRGLTENEDLVVQSVEESCSLHDSLPVKPFIFSHPSLKHLLRDAVFISVRFFLFSETHLSYIRRHHLIPSSWSPLVVLWKEKKKVNYSFRYFSYFDLNVSK